MNIKELIEKAVENLNRVRQLNLNITGTLSLSDNDDAFYVSILDNENGCAFDVASDENMSNQQLLPDDPENLSPDDKCGFIIFDINIDGWDLKRKDVDDIANKLGLPSVPVVFEGTLDEAKEFVAKHQMSTLNGGLHEMEGIVLVPRDIQLYDNKHKMVKCKCKYRDMLKAGLTQ